jgi:hypothetical protein
MQFVLVIRNYHMLCNIPEERRSHRLRGGSLKSRLIRVIVMAVLCVASRALQQ